ncbi:MAG: hypothetical protein DI539_06915 [Flavobacterium psychrophilum]|nr:MAG: hypothetical protein DI539_06915 [Flavobacterium psychrophilum]
MKRIYLLGALATFTVSCSNDDNNGNNNNPSENYLPLAEGNYWVYDVQGTSMNGRDSIYFYGDTVINNTTYKKVKSKDPIATGFFSNALNNNGIRYADGKTYLSGTAGLSLTEQLPFNLNVTDFIIFDVNAANNEQLSLTEGNITQEVDGYTLIFDYKLSSKAKAPIANFTSGNEQYTHVMPVEITLNLKIQVATTFQGFPITVTLMEPQNVLVSTQYYAEGIGAVKSSNDISYNLAELPGFELPIPQSGTEHQEEVLVDYKVE